MRRRWCLALVSLAAFAPSSLGAQQVSPTASPAASAAASGAAVVLIGSDEERAKDCRELARAVYAKPSLRPAIDESAAKALCSTDSSAQAGQKLAELRASLHDRIDNAATQAVLTALGSELPSEAVVLVSKGERGTLVRVVRRGAKEADPLSFDLAPGADGAPVAWADVAQALDLSLREAPTPKAPGGERPGPVRSLAAPIGKDPVPEAPTPFFESPWFWVAAGSVAALGLAILIVSQTTDVGEGTVKIEGKVLP